ncbi:MAG: rhamnulokinase [Spirochaetaceae bacterium]|jgi:rhamnulokinase|nr:rhamnulokinase [Spirochaetaceae bacterium]
MKSKYHVAVDLGASSGRLILGWLEDGRFALKEAHRFSNGFVFREGHERWDIDSLVDEILSGLEKIKSLGIESCTLGIDSWGVDYVALDAAGNKLADPVAYRDERTRGMIDKVCARFPRTELYRKTGIQFVDYNTLYQLCAEERDIVERAATFLFIADYIAYKLTGRMACEETLSSTSQFLPLSGLEFDSELLALAGVRREQFPAIVKAGTALGPLDSALSNQYDLPQVEVIAVASHDTASAIAAVPLGADQKPWAFLSSGTWSLLGLERSAPIATAEACAANFANERGYNSTYCFLKNIPGMWILQEARRQGGWEYSYREIDEIAEREGAFAYTVDPLDSRFTNPQNMIVELQNACRERSGIAPQTVGEIANCIYQSLAECYRNELANIKELSGEAIEHLYIVGGGSNSGYLNQLVANTCKLSISAGPAEATALGNIFVQMICKGELPDISAARALINSSFDIASYIPS